MLVFFFILSSSGTASDLVISESTGPIFAKFSGLVDVYGRACLTVHSFCDYSRDAAMATNLGAKYVNLADSTFIRRIDVPK